MSKISIPLVGLRHRVTPTTLRELAELTPIKAKLAREPGNLHDKNAITVTLMEKPHRDFQIGYVSREVAKEFAKRMDRGKLVIEEAWVTEINAEDGNGEILVTTRKPNKQ